MKTLLPHDMEVEEEEERLARVTWLHQLETIPGMGRVRTHMRALMLLGHRLTYTRLSNVQGCAQYNWPTHGHVIYMNFHRTRPPPSSASTRRSAPCSESTTARRSRRSRRRTTWPTRWAEMCVEQLDGIHTMCTTAVAPRAHAQASILAPRPSPFDSRSRTTVPPQCAYRALSKRVFAILTSKNPEQLLADD